MANRIKQIGLTINKKHELDTFLDRVDRYNRTHSAKAGGQLLVEVEYMEAPQHDIEKGDARYRLIIEYLDRAIIPHFWTN